MSYRKSGKWVYDDKSWRKLRRLILERDEYICQVRLPICTVYATQVDHIIRPADGGGRFDPQNLRATCQPCNSSRGGKVGAPIKNKRGRRRNVSSSRKW